MAKFSFEDLMNSVSRQQETSTDFIEIWLNPRDVKPSESNFYSQEDIEELADTFLTVGQLDPTVLAKINNEYRIVSGHRRNLANILNLDRGHERYNKVKYHYKEMTETMFELSLIVGNAYNRILTPYEKTEQVARLKAALKKAKKEDGLEIHGSMRDLISDILKIKPTNIARYESINNNLVDQAKEEFKKGNLGITAAYDTSRLEKAEQEAIAARIKAGEDVRDKEIAEMTANAKAKKAADAKLKADISQSKAAEKEKELENLKTLENTKVKSETDISTTITDVDTDTGEIVNKKVTHRLKTASQYFKDVVNGLKTFELRINDRDYKVGDTLNLCEYKDGIFTGLEHNVEVTYILDSFTGLKDDYCIMGIKEVQQ